MADDREQWTDTLSAAPTGLTGFLAEEDPSDRRMLWRLGSWGAGAVAAVTVAILAAQSQSHQRRDQVAAAELLARQSQQIQFVAKETQTEARRLSQAIETLNGDRDRLYSRVTSIEQGLESVTGSIKRQSVATAAPVAAPPTLPPALVSPATVEPVLHVTAPPPMAAPAPAPSVAPVAATPPAAETPRPSAAAAIAPSAPLMPAKSILAPPEPVASKLSEPPAPEPVPAAAPETTASIQIPPDPTVAAEPVAVPVPRTEFGVDLGGANSVEGLRALWRGLAHTRELNGLRPIMIVKERGGGYGMQLRLIAGPLNDAAAAARLCAALVESKRSCETSVFEGQRLALKNEPPQEAAPRPAPVPAPRKRAAPKQERTERVVPPPPPAEEPAPPPKPQSSLSSILGLR